MKKYLFSIVAIVLFSMGAKAQFTLGVKGGVNFSKLSTDNLSGSNVAGYEVGAWARFGKGFYLQPELYVGSKGGEFHFQTSDISTSGSAKVRFTTLDVPLLLGQSFGVSSLNFRIMAGPVYSYVLNRDDSFTSNLGAAYRDFGSYNHSTLGYQAGVGVDLGTISIDGRYEGGLTKISDRYGQKPSLFHISLGFKIL